MAVTPWPALTATAALAKAIRELGAAIGEGDDHVVQRLGAAASALVEGYAPSAPLALRCEAAVRVAGWLRETPRASLRGERMGEVSTMHAPSMRGALLHSGAKSLLYAYRAKRAGVAK